MSQRNIQIGRDSYYYALESQRCFGLLGSNVNELRAEHYLPYL